jgi:predicted enzyme related to lactoylglutathione lyase
VFLDPSGAAFATWQAGTHPGAELFNAPGSVTWNELATRDTESSKTFYNEVFGWTAEDAPLGPVTYTTWKLGERSVGGMIEMVGDEWPADLTALDVYFAVEDTDTTAGPITGGAISVPSDLPVGRFSVLSDNSGAFFIITLSQPPACGLRTDTRPRAGSRKGQSHPARNRPRPARSADRARRR